MGTVAVIGIGLIGGSYGLALKARGLADRVIGCARTRSTLDAALARGAADDVTGRADEACREADLVILCQPPSAIAQMMPIIADSLRPDAAVTDAGSVKSHIVSVGESHLGGRFIGGHPMAGSEKTGVEHADGDLFEGATYILTPTDRTDPNALAAIRGLAEQVGSDVRVMSPDAHDAAVASASHVPHIVAAALARAVIEREGVADVHSSGLRDTTRVAAGDARMWRQILEANGQAIDEPLSQVLSELGELRAALQSGDGDLVEAWLERASTMRSRLTNTPGGAR